MNKFISTLMNQIVLDIQLGELELERVINSTDEESTQKIKKTKTAIYDIVKNKALLEELKSLVKEAEKNQPNLNG